MPAMNRLDIHSICHTLICVRVPWEGGLWCMVSSASACLHTWLLPMCVKHVPAHPTFADMWNTAPHHWLPVDVHNSCANHFLQQLCHTFFFLIFFFNFEIIQFLTKLDNSRGKFSLSFQDWRIYILSNRTILKIVWPKLDKESKLLDDGGINVHLFLHYSNNDIMFEVGL